jgi:hypothetical protein
MFDIESDPQERYNLLEYRFDNDWMFFSLLPYLAEWEKSVAKYPNIKPGEEFTGY